MSITIPDSVTSIGIYAFYGCTALTDVYYGGTEEQKAAIAIGSDNDPLINATWHYAEPEKIEFAGASVVLHSDLGINFKLDSQLLDKGDYEDPYIVCNFRGKESVIRSSTQADGKHVFKFTNIAPNQFGEEITATLYATQDGQLVQGDTITYSVSDYCYNMLETCKPENDPEGKYGELRTLLVDLLHYGAASQSYVGNTDVLVDAALTETQLAWGTSADPALSSITTGSYETVESPSVTWKSASLFLRDSVAVRVRFAAESIEGLTMQVKVAGRSYNISSAKFVATETEGVYYAQFDALETNELREAIYFTVCKDGVAVSNTLRYSVESYAYSYQNNANANLAALVKAMMRYGDSAAALVK